MPDPVAGSAAMHDEANRIVHVVTAGELASLRVKAENAVNAAEGAEQSGDKELAAMYVIRAHALAHAISALTEPFGGDWTRRTLAFSVRLENLTHKIGATL